MRRNCRSGSLTTVELPAVRAEAEVVGTDCHFADAFCPVGITLIGTRQPPATVPVTIFSVGRRRKPARHRISSDPQLCRHNARDRDGASIAATIVQQVVAGIRARPRQKDSYDVMIPLVVSS
jgi:hypothetical protein